MKLVIEDAAGTRSIVPFTSDELTVGRAAEGNAWRLADRNVSRRHARFVRASGAVFVEDLGSLTGTRVNGERVVGRRRLREGDLVEIGDYDLALLPDVDAPGRGSPPPLPPTPRPAEPAEPLKTVEMAVVTGIPRAAPARPLARTLVAAGVAALVLGAAAGFAAGELTAPEPAPPAARR